MAAVLQVIGRRLLSALPSVVGVILVTFLLTRMLPGDPAAYFAGPAATQEAIAEIRQQLGLDRSLPHQFWVYISELLRGELGVSHTTGQTVLYDLSTRLPASLELTLTAVVFALLISIPLGILAATNPGSWIDHLARLVSTAGVSLPTFFTGLLLVYIFYFRLDWLPGPVGRLDLFSSAPPHVTGSFLIDSLLARDGSTFFSALQHLILPSITLGIFALAPFTRVTRAALLGVLSSDFIRTARASGLPPHQILFGYALRNAMLPVLTTCAVVFSFLLGANVLVEKVFAWPGIGSYAIEALIASDYAPVQGFVLTMALLYIGLNLVIDLVYGVLDPRVEVRT